MKRRAQFKMGGQFINQQPYVSIRNCHILSRWLKLTFEGTLAMTIKKLIEKYTRIKKDYDSVFVTEILNDLWQIKKQNDFKREIKKARFN